MRLRPRQKRGTWGTSSNCIVYKEEVVRGRGQNGKPKTEKVIRFRAPKAEDDISAVVEAKLQSRMPLWRARNIVPDEEIDALSNYDRGHRMYGISRWSEFFSPRQLYGHCVAVEVYQDMLAEFGETELDRAAMTYIALALDKMVNYNAIQVRWHARSVTA